MSSAPVLVLGAGPTGLSAAYHLGGDAMLIEREDRVGGWCRSIECDGFTFDLAGHIMFSNDPYVHELYRMLLGENVHWQDREAWIWSHGVYTRYPFQGALHGLPKDVIRECLIGAIEARYGAWRAALPEPHAHPNGNGACANGNGNGVHDCCADGILAAETPLVERAAAGPAHGNGNGNGHPASEEPRNFEEFIYRVWGAGIAKHFAVPYNRKLWAVPLDEMETSWLGGRVPMPDLGEMIDGALSPVPRPMGPNARFGYPRRGGFQALMDGFLPHLANPPRLGLELVALAPERHEARLSDGSTVRYDSLVSTIPLPELVKRIADAPAEIRDAAYGLRRVSVRCVNLGIGRPALTDKHWIYYPEDPVFHRIFVQGNASPGCNPPGGFALTCEITYGEKKPLPCTGYALVRRCLDDCRKVGMLREDDPVWTAFETDLPYAYVVYDHSRASRVATIRSWLDRHDVILAGRYSEWEYYNSDHAFLAGRRAAETVRARSETSEPAARPRGVTNVTT